MLALHETVKLVLRVKTKHIWRGGSVHIQGGLYLAGAGNASLGQVMTGCVVCVCVASVHARAQANIYR